MIDIEKIEERIKYETMSKEEWESICKQPLIEDFIRQYKDYVEWHLICVFSKLSESFLEEFIDKIDWGLICQYQTLSEIFMNKHKSDGINFQIISEYQNLSQKFIDENVPYFDWFSLCKYQKLSAEFIDKYFIYLHTYKFCLCSYQVLPEWLIKKYFNDFKDSKHLSLICRYQHLSENFLRKYDRIIDFNIILEYQDLSKSFILDYFKNFSDRTKLCFIYKKLIPIRFNKHKLNLLDNIYFMIRKFNRIIKKFFI